MKSRINKKKTYLIVSLVLILSLGIYKITFGSQSDPGTQGDPLTTVSYVQTKVNELKTYIDNKISEISSGNGETFKIVELKAGEQLIGNAGTEIILRAGTVKAIIGEYGGISDITQGKDLEAGEIISKNHLLIIPRDGRGAEVVTYGTFMVKGKYTVK
ncbi:hypothetical protein CLPU_4c02270 [Gottschalkia purinilytica]|uniref:Uncharacterized protein n=1 Tax=Gottschalkia purinilytica TaxID=1503 RepID=A0A0L0WCJ3_GOTPU|nr:hypothetical protein [Gottschalkia purinilytica]KNF09181.1 hypothetical protein CLPU_4c02270 [Gottschalkia purinilytica]